MKNKSCVFYTEEIIFVVQFFFKLFPVRHLTALT